jgi:hypothetical protein
MSYDINRLGPTAKKLYGQGLVWLDNISISPVLVGTASDGVRVLLGAVHDAPATALTEEYLKDHPTPDTW